MSLRESFEAEMLPVRRSTFQDWVNALPEQDRAIVLEFAVNPQLSNNGFLRVVKAAGALVGKETVTAWRRAQGHEPR